MERTKREREVGEIDDEDGEIPAEKRQHGEEVQEQPTVPAASDSGNGENAGVEPAAGASADLVAGPAAAPDPAAVAAAHAPCAPAAPPAAPVLPPTATGVSTADVASVPSTSTAATAGTLDDEQLASLLQKRFDAKARRDWSTADSIRSQLESYGFKVIDQSGSWIDSTGRRYVNPRASLFALPLPHPFLLTLPSMHSVRVVQGLHSRPGFFFGPARNDFCCGGRCCAAGCHDQQRRSDQEASGTA